MNELSQLRFLERIYCEPQKTLGQNQGVLLALYLPTNVPHGLASAANEQTINLVLS